MPTKGFPRRHGIRLKQPRLEPVDLVRARVAEAPFANDIAEIPTLVQNNRVAALPFDKYSPKPPSAFAWVHRWECWLELEIDDEWIAAYRIVPQEGGVVVAELRVFPLDRGSDRKPSTPGLWSGEVLGIAASAPKGGLSARTLRRVKLNLHKKHAQEALNEIRKIVGDDFLQAFGLPAMSAATKKRSKSERRGRRPLDESVLAEIAQRYVEATAAGSRSPVKHVAAQLGFTIGKVRSALHKARARGILSKTKWGTAGGRLTRKGKKLLAQNASRPKGVEA